MNFRYFIQLRYKGTNYSGWQIQANAITVQQVLQKAFSLYFRKEVEIVGAGRTDTGVHAEKYFAHFDIDSEILNSLKVVYQLNSMLPKDISIDTIFRVKPEIHARFSAISRTYEYRISKVKNPFLENLVLFNYSLLNINIMNEAAEILKNYNDFESFCKLHSDVKTFLCKIFSASWTETDNLLIFRITADRFLRNMVRAIVGTMLELGKEKISITDFKAIIEGKSRNSAGMSVSPDGLFLTDIQYPEDILLLQM